MQENKQLLAPVDVAGGQDSVSHSLNVLASVYNYNHWIFSMIRDHLGDSVLEVGAGIGNITRFMLNVDRLVCLEPYAPYHAYLARHFSKHLNVEVVASPVEECPNDRVSEGAFDAIVCLNVLEHITDDGDVLIRCNKLLKPGGKMIVLVPALSCLYGEMDRAMGHIRRYSKKSLGFRFQEAGLKVVASRYMNMPGVLGWWWQGRILRRSLIPEQGTRLFDRCVPYISAFERIMPVPIGQSLVMVGKKSKS